MIKDVGYLQTAASLVLVAVAVLLSLWLRLGLTRQLLVAAGRAAVQLVAVGVLFGFIIESGRSIALAWIWVVAMVAITSFVARRRAPDLPGGATIAGLAVAVTVCISLAVVFGLGILDYGPVNLIVIAGITIGNSMPSQVLGAKLIMTAVRESRGQIEAFLSLGFSVPQVVRLIGGQIARTALIPQIERTNVTGLIALPGAMTGLLLAGADPIDAVLIQVVVMYLVLGAGSTSVILTVVIGLRQLFTPDLRLRTLSPDRTVG